MFYKNNFNLPAIKLFYRSNLFFKQVSGDLMAYCRHAHRTTIELADVELLMKRFALELYVCNFDSLFHYDILNVCLHAYRWLIRLMLHYCC